MQIGEVCILNNRSGKPHLGRQLGVPPRVAALSAATAAARSRQFTGLSASLRSRYSFGKRATGTFACASAHAANHRRDGFQRSPSADWSALAACQARTAGIALVTSRFPGAHLTLLTVIARCTNVLTNAPSAPLLTCSILPCAWRSGVCSPTSARLLRVGLPALKARHRPGS